MACTGARRNVTNIHLNGATFRKLILHQAEMNKTMNIYIKIYFIICISYFCLKTRYCSCGVLHYLVYLHLIRTKLRVHCTQGIIANLHCGHKLSILNHDSK